MTDQHNSLMTHQYDFDLLMWTDRHEAEAILAVAQEGVSFGCALIGVDHEGTDLDPNDHSVIGWAVVDPTRERYLAPVDYGLEPEADDFPAPEGYVWVNVA